MPCPVLGLLSNVEVYLCSSIDVFEYSRVSGMSERSELYVGDMSHCSELYVSDTCECHMSK